MEVTAKDVSKQLRRHLVPYLRANGFDDATGRKFWRRRDGKTDHIEIASMSAYHAKVDNCTTASFYVRLGISLPDYGFHNDPYYKDHIKVGPKGARPDESVMPIRGVLCPPGSPPLEKRHYGWHCNARWDVNSQADAEKAAIELHQQFETFALEWLDREWDLHKILELLQRPENRLFLVTHDDGSHLQMNAELPGSPIRNTHIELVERALQAGN